MENDTLVDPEKLLQEQKAKESENPEGKDDKKIDEDINNKMFVVVRNMKSATSNVVSAYSCNGGKKGFFYLNSTLKIRTLVIPNIVPHINFFKISLMSIIRSLVSRAIANLLCVGKLQAE